MKRFSDILGLALAAIIVLTAQSAAIARTMPDATGQMVICTGTGPLMVYMDENGEPTGAPHICPDYGLSLIVALHSSHAFPIASGAWKDGVVPVSHTEPAILKFGTPSARGPPVLI